MKIVGIYKITNLKNGKIYIGQSIDVLERFIQHKSDLKGNRHVNKHLQSAYNLYGLKNFSFEILEECSKKELDKKEKYWIDYYGGVNSKTNYNQKDGGHEQACLSEESIFLMKIKKKGKRNSPRIEFKRGMVPWNKGKKGYNVISKYSKKVYQYDLEGNFIKEYPSVSIASKENNVSKSLISLLCIKNAVSLNSQWSYEKKSKFPKAKLKLGNKKPVYQYDLEGNFIKEYPSAASAAREIGAKASSIEACCIEYKRISCKGYQWKHYLSKKGIEKAKAKDRAYKSRKPVLQFDLDGVFIKEWISIKQIENELNYSHCSISKCCNGKCKKAYGSIWRFK